MKLKFNEFRSANCIDDHIKIYKKVGFIYF